MLFSFKIKFPQINVSCLYKAIDEEVKKIKPILPKNIIHAQIHQISKTQRSLPCAQAKRQPTTCSRNLLDRHVFLWLVSEKLKK